MSSFDFAASFFSCLVHLTNVERWCAAASNIHGIETQMQHGNDKQSQWSSSIVGGLLLHEVICNGQHCQSFGKFCWFVCFVVCLHVFDPSVVSVRFLLVSHEGSECFRLICVFPFCKRVRHARGRFLVCDVSASVGSWFGTLPRKDTSTCRLDFMPCFWLTVQFEVCIVCACRTLVGTQFAQWVAMFCLEFLCFILCRSDVMFGMGMDARFWCLLLCVKFCDEFTTLRVIHV